jgi:hypothetical protein
MGLLFKYIVVLFVSTSPVVEGNSIVVPICLSHAPSGNVTISLSATGLSFSSSSLTFTSGDYSTPQDVTVSVTNDATDTSGIETRKILLRATSSDSGYSGDSTYIGVKTFDGAYSINAVLAQDTLINRAQKYTAKGLDSLRIQLVRSLWEGYSLPTISASVTNSTYTGTYKILNASLTAACREITYANTLFSYKAYVFEPSVIGNGKIVYYTEGHFATATEGGQVPLLDSCLARGYVVVYIPMLAYFGSTQYLAPISQIHTINPQSYININPLSHFLNAYVSVVNYCEDHYAPTESVMMGLSGGGWATTVYAAIDTRIDKMISMSGTQPIYVNWQNGFGDFEQGFAAVTPSSINDIYNAAGRYLDLYAMCSYQRKYIQIQARYDPCCFGGKYYQTWADKTQQIVRKVGGIYKHFLTQESCHCVGSKISIVLSEL